MHPPLPLTSVSRRPTLTCENAYQTPADRGLKDNGRAHIPDGGARWHVWTAHQPLSGDINTLERLMDSQDLPM